MSLCKFERHHKLWYSEQEESQVKSKLFIIVIITNMVTGPDLLVSMNFFDLTDSVHPYVRTVILSQNVNPTINGLSSIQLLILILIIRNKMPVKSTDVVVTARETRTGFD